MYFGSTARTRGLQLGECRVTHKLWGPFFNSPSRTKPHYLVRKYAPIQRGLYKDFSILGYGGNRFFVLTFAFNCFRLQGSPNCPNYREEGWKQVPPKPRKQSSRHQVSVRTDLDIYTGFIPSQLMTSTSGCCYSL